MDSSCYGGGDIAGSVIGTLLCTLVILALIWWLYRKYYSPKKKDSHLVVEDPENVKNDFAFDNPAFKNDGTKTSSPLDTKWMTTQNGGASGSGDKRKTVDDSYTGSPTPRMVSLRGSDFTGLGIEICGGLKEGIFVKKVMAQGPAVGIISLGDRITSITIDFRHIVQEDATSILSYASPYNVQLELVDGKNSFPTVSQSPKQSNSPLSHPLYRSSSQDNLDTIERNSRKKLFPNDNSNYPTLKMENSTPPSYIVLPSVHRENEKKKIKGMVEEKLQNRSSHHEPEQIKVEIEQKPITPDEKKGLKFGIRVLPPNVNEKIFGKSPNKVQADNENNLNLEKKEQIEIKKETPPTAKRRSKDKIGDNKTLETEFQRQGSINSSGIKRDSAGIPQEVPNHMMQAAMAAKDNRKSGGAAIDLKKSKGKAPRPPPTHMDHELDVSTDTVDTNLSFDVGDKAMKKPELINMEKLNFSDNFADQILEKSIDTLPDFDKIEHRGPSNSSTPKSDRKKTPSDTESQIAAKEGFDGEDSTEGNQIELNSNHITIHQTSEEESGDEGRRTASLGDLSKFDSKIKFTPGSNSGTLERAQSLEMTDSAIQTSGGKNQTKKRKAQTDADFTENKEPRLMNHDLDGMDTLQRVRLKSAYEFGTLQDVIYDENRDDDNLNDSKSDAESSQKHMSVDIVKEVMAAADKFNRELRAEIAMVLESDKRYEDNQNLTEETKKNNENNDDVVFISNAVEQIPGKPEKPEKPEKPAKRISANSDELILIKNFNEIVLEKPQENGVIDDQTNSQKIVVNETHVTTTNQIPINEEISVSHFRFSKNDEDKSKVPEWNSSSTIMTSTREEDIKPIQNGVNYVFKEDHITISPITLQQVEDPVSIEISPHPNVTDHVKIINFGTNVSDDVKVSRYPFGSLERPKSDVLKKLMGISPEINNQTTTTTTTTTTTIFPDEHLYLETQPISLTLIGGTESDLTESSQISPVYSSDNQGVNSISISSMEVNIGPESLKRETVIMPGKLGVENIVTISTESSQPSSIIMIEDEKLDFTLQTPDGSEDGYSSFVTRNEIDDKDILINRNKKDEMKTFVTEITVQSNNDNIKISDDDREMVKIISNSISDNNISLDESPIRPTSLITNFMSQEKRNIEDNYLPRNSEIRFTTSTYESPNKQMEKRVSQIEQIRSNFEKNNQNNSEIPVRKSSIPTLKSPSKIPVFNSKITNDGQFQTVGTNGNGNRLSVSVTSIKNSSRHPSGK